MTTLTSPTDGIITYGPTEYGYRIVSITDYNGESIDYEIPLIINNKITKFRPEGTEIRIGDSITE